MSLTPPPNLAENDFEQIEDAVMETARGRWFLKEFARRTRNAETGRLLDAMGRIEKTLALQESVAISRFEVEKHAVSVDERCQRIGGIAGSLRERGYDGSLCALIETEAEALAALATAMRAGARLVADVEPDPMPSPRPVVLEGTASRRRHDRTPRPQPRLVSDSTRPV
jgi:hypothetical protein